ncbi:MAG: T9SS type A sorting domain-containing protein [Bacteroidales bacterium]|nr:T9SS type A sorting domain-containing protein [Bacteroidales bacterium]
MKKVLFTTILLFLVSVSFPDRYITRGPNPGEIYFLGPTCTGEGLYYSTDYGMTAVCVDSTIYQALTITAGKTPGVVYYATMLEALHISYNYGNTGTWQYVNGGISLYINSGVTEGYIYNAIVSHSEDFGNNFIPHNYTGFFGSLIDSEVDNQSNIGYAIVNKYGVNDSLYLLMTYDNYENLFVKHVFNMFSSSFVRMSRGNQNGKLYFLQYNSNKILFSNQYGENWIEVNNLNFHNYIDQDIVGGRNDGELYLIYNFVNMMWQNAHTYILHSIDYGVSFELFHPFSKGQKPLLANFSAKKEEDANSIINLKDIDSIYYVSGEMPLSVQFYNYSIGDINIYEWDFNSDGLIDSFEENPVYTYADTGWYSVNLTVYDDFDTNSFVKEIYVYVYKITDIKKNIGIANKQISCYPNPFSKQITITYPQSDKSETNELIVYNNVGKIIKRIKSNNEKIIWDGTNNSGNKCLPGIYLIKLNNLKFSQKVILT